MSQATTSAEWTIPESEEVRAFAEEQGVAAYLTAVLQATRRIFPMAKRRAIYVEEDPEIANDRHIVVEAEVRMDISEALAARRQWHEAVFQCCPAPLICVFRLSVDLVE